MKQQYKKMYTINMRENNKTQWGQTRYNKSSKRISNQKHQANQAICTLLTWRSLSRTVPHQQYVSWNPCDQAHSCTVTALF